MSRASIDPILREIETATVAQQQGNNPPFVPLPLHASAAAQRLSVPPSHPTTTTVCTSCTTRPVIVPVRVRLCAYTAVQQLYSVYSYLQRWFLIHNVPMAI
jgi:hypothetical protein